MRKFYILAAVALAALVIGLAYAEQITFSTYYPAPHGVYREMRSTRTTIGDAYYDGGTHSWGGTINDDADLVVEGRVGIGTTSPVTSLEVLDDDPSDAPEEARLYATSYSNSFGGHFMGRRARGSVVAPVAVTANTELALFGGLGYDGASFPNSSRGRIGVYAAANWNAASHPTEMRFYTTANGATVPSINMVIADNGNVGIGPLGAGSSKLEVSGGTVKTTGGFILETRDAAAGDPASPVDGQMWLRTDITP